MTLSPPEQRLRHSELVLAGWRALIWFAALAQVLIGATLLWKGEHGFDPHVFRDSILIPWWLWGTWAIAGGLAMPWVGMLRNFGVTVTVIWYGLWWALLTSGILKAPDFVATYPIVVYGFLTAIHIILWAVEFLSANPWIDKGSRDGG